ncbi:MAG: MOSC domain-containing protein [Methanocellales archaeon]|nr:MOSC domain-containing protein [Methanocellales archaeon]
MHRTKGFDRSRNTAKIIAVCRSEKKGERKEAIDQGIFKEGYGLLGDAHANSDTHRQVSLLAIESIDKMKKMGLDLKPGDFAENFTTEGIDLTSLKPGTRINIGDEVILEISQIGKECHSGCAILKQVGKCIMPEEGVFAKVIRGGLVKADDAIQKV